MLSTEDDQGWLPHVRPGATPIYQQILDAITAAVETGTLRAGERLPPQRLVAARLGVDLTTVTRAYTAARKSNLLVAIPGRGTFVASQENRLTPPLDLSMNIPPAPKDMRLGELIETGVSDILRRSNVEQLMSYHSGPGALADRSAGAAWLEPVLGRLEPDRVVIMAGAQAALAAILSVETGAGDAVLTDELTYPGMVQLARQMGLRLVGVAGDEHGMAPAALEEACLREEARLVYLTPTMHNPTAVTMPPARRQALAEAIRRAGLRLIEDDPYAVLATHPLAAIAALVPDAAYHISTVSKCLTPGLRCAFVVPPSTDSGEALAQAGRALVQMPAPMMVALLTLWIRNGMAMALRDGVRAEARERQSLARRILPAGGSAQPEGLHVWQPLPDRWSAAELIAAAGRQGLGIIGADAFHVSGPEPRMVRISLGAISQRAQLEQALQTLAQVFQTEADTEAATS